MNRPKVKDKTKSSDSSIRSIFERAPFILLPLLVSLTATASQDSPPVPNMPPTNIEFDLSDLKEADQKQRDEWASYQTSMSNAFSEVESFSGSDSNISLKIESYRRFLATYEVDNPHSQIDDSLRGKARQEISRLEEEAEVLSQERWAIYQTRLSAAFRETEKFLESEPDLNLQVRALERFLESFNLDNPHSEEDELIRSRAVEMLANVGATKKAPDKGPVIATDPTFRGLFFADLDFQSSEDQQAFAEIVSVFSDETKMESSLIRSKALISRHSENPDKLLIAKLQLNHSILLIRSGLSGEATRYVNAAYVLTKNEVDGLPLVFNSFVQLGILNFSLGRYSEAISALRFAEHIMNRDSGLFMRYETLISDYLMITCYRAKNTSCFDQEQFIRLLKAERRLGGDSPELVGKLIELGSHFAGRGASLPIMFTSEMRMKRDVLFKHSINMYQRAIEIIERQYGSNDLRLIEPLRGLASARMLKNTGRKFAEEALLRSLDIVSNNPDSDPTDKAQALIDLGDLYIITSDSSASETYLRAWEILQASPETQHLAHSAFDSPIRLFPRIQPTLFLERRPYAANPGDELFIQLTFDVNAFGRVENVRLLEKNVPSEQFRALRQRIKGSRYRPRIKNGELVETKDIELRQLFEVLVR